MKKLVPSTTTWRSPQLARRPASRDADQMQAKRIFTDPPRLRRISGSLARERISPDKANPEPSAPNFPGTPGSSSGSTSGREELAIVYKRRGTNNQWLHVPPLQFIVLQVAVISCAKLDLAVIKQDWNSSLAAWWGSCKSGSSVATAWCETLRPPINPAGHCANNYQSSPKLRLRALREEFESFVPSCVQPRRLCYVWGEGTNDRSRAVGEDTYTHSRRSSTSLFIWFADRHEQAYTKRNHASCARASVK